MKCREAFICHYQIKSMHKGECAMTMPYHTPSGDLSKELVKKGQDFFLKNYKPREMILDRGVGARVWDLDGNEYIDFSTGIAVNSLGHQDPDLLAALDVQSRKLWHTSNVFFTEPAIHLAEALVDAVPFAKRAYFCNSGTEASEAAIKLVRKFAHDAGKPADAREIITFAGSFHGRTYAAMTATAQPKYQEPFQPLPAGFVYCDTFNDLEAVKALITDKTQAIMVEPIQGEGGVVPAKDGFLRGLRQLCDQHGLLLVYDEVQCGMGRTGKLFGYMWEEGAEPDILTSAKALGCGVPVGAVLVGEKLVETFQFGSHGSTFGGNPLMCAVALAAFKKISRPEIMAHATAQAAKLVEGLEVLREETKLFTQVRGRGLMIGVELVPDWHGKANEIAALVRGYGLLILVAGPNVLRILPPLTITDEELNEGLKRLRQGLAAL